MNLGLRELIRDDEPYVPFRGLVVGFSIAVPIGPMGLLGIQRTLTLRMRVGVCTGLGAATVNVVYGALIIFISAKLEPVISSGAPVLSFLGSAFLLWCAVRKLMRRRTLVGEPTIALRLPVMAYESAQALNINTQLRTC